MIREGTPTSDVRPAYDHGTFAMDRTRAHLGDAFARQALATATASAILSGRPWETLRVLDVGCGYGQTTVAFARHCASVVGIEPSSDLAAKAVIATASHPNARIVEGDFLAWSTTERFDLIVLDNVLEHIADKAGTICKLSEFLAPGGAFYIVVPNKLWPIEVHYKLPFLSYLPLPLANAYLRATRRGTDYRDASYAPTIWQLRRAFRLDGTLTYRFVLPADLSLTETGASPLYRIGAALLARFPVLWAISKAFVVVGGARENDVAD